MTEQLYPKYPILLIDDEKNILRSYELALQSAGINNIISCGGGLKARKIVKTQNVELIILDMMMTKISGDKLLDEFNSEYPEIPIIMATCVDSLEKAVECIHHGAAEYMVKPIDVNKLLEKIRKHLDINELKRENERLRNSLLSKDDQENYKSFTPIITNSKYMYALFRYCSAIAASKQSVLITGETGVGKELFANALHEESKCRGELVTVNIAGLDDNMISDTLFGHTKGAFTGAVSNRRGIIEKAGNGTLFIDEIGDLNMVSQIKLLRLLQQGEYLQLGSDKVKISSARIILATNRDLHELQRDEKFRKDLYYRIATHHIDIPPLRDRSDDIVLLLDSFIAAAAKELKKKIPKYPDELITLLKSYCFPGNIRELAAMVYDAVSSHQSKTLSTKVFFAHIKRNSINNTGFHGENVDLETCLADLVVLPGFKELDIALIQEAMNRAAGNQSVAAGMLGVTPQALSSRLKKIKKAGSNGF
ncbi:MAG: sigma-54-dependent Fis family transcriptional regulator [Victivallaceae bacterium]|nr:sigma-54-dependent Fis family transcriptional regulator [Victivallaceae bacterium]